MEEVVGRLPTVAEVAVAGVPDPTWGQRVVAWVVPADPGNPRSLEEIGMVVGGELAPWAAPKQVVIMDYLPRRSLGKPRRLRLAAMEG